MVDRQLIVYLKTSSICTRSFYNPYVRLHLHLKCSVQLKREGLGSRLPPTVFWFFDSLIAHQNRNPEKFCNKKPSWKAILCCVARWFYCRIYVGLRYLQWNFSIIPIQCLYYSSNTSIVAFLYKWYQIVQRLSNVNHVFNLLFIFLGECIICQAGAEFFIFDYSLL